MSDYISIDSLQEYILVEQERPRLQTFYRQPDGIWAIGAAVEWLDASLTIASVGATIPLAEIYAGVNFTPVSPT